MKESEIPNNNKLEYNGWIIFLLVMAVLFSEDWFFLGAILLCIIYVGWIEYLRMKYRKPLEQNGK